MKLILIIVALFGAITFPFLAYAESPMELVIVTPTRMEQPLDKTIADTTVLDEREIKKSGVPDVPTLLRSLAGIEVYQNGGLGKQSSTFMRGTNSSHVLVLLDGVRINSATAGTTQIDQLMLDQIERIEVVRGNTSSLYGSEAIGGIIQIFTKRGKDAPALNFSAGYGAHRTQRTAVGFGGETGDTAFNIQVSRNKTDGISAVSSNLVPAVNPDEDGYDNTSMSANMQHSFGEDHSLSASLFDSNATNQTDNSFGLITDVNSSKSRIQKVSVTSENRWNKGWQSNVQLSQGVDDTQNYLNGAPDVALGAQFKTTSDLLSWQNTLQVGDNGVLIVGLEKLKQQVTSSTSYSRTSRSDDSLFVGYTGSYNVQQVQLNWRSDKYSDSGTANTWLLGYGFEVDEAWRITASMATAFKAPTLNDLFYPFTDYGSGFTYVGNPNLKPERSRNSDLGLRYSRDGQRLDVIRFDNRIHDLIAINNLPAATMINLDDARSDGVELAYNGQFANTGVRLAYTQQNPRDARTGEVLLRRAKNFASLSILRQINALQVSGEWQYSGERTDIDINTFARTALAAYDVINVTVSYALNKHLNLSARVDNALNADYMRAHGYNTLGRTLFVGLNYQQ